MDCTPTTEVSQNEDGEYIDSGVFNKTYSVSVGIKPDEGYKEGDLSLTINGILLIKGEDYSWEDIHDSGNYQAFVSVPYGATLNISATNPTIDLGISIKAEQVNNNTPKMYIRNTSSRNYTNVTLGFPNNMAIIDDDVLANSSCGK